MPIPILRLKEYKIKELQYVERNSEIELFHRFLSNSKVHNSGYSMYRLQFPPSTVLHAETFLT